MRLLPRDQGLGWTPFGWLVYLLSLFVEPWLTKASAGEWVLTIALIVAFLPLYFYGYWLSGWRLIPLMATITLFGVILVPFNGAGGVFFIYAAAYAGFMGPPRLAGLAVGIIAIISAIQPLALGHHPFRWVWAVVFTVIVGAMNIHFAQVHRSNAKLRMAREEVEHLAKVAERERIARDLHDLLGHTLSVIVLKSELASKIGETDPPRAMQEVREVEAISRDALKQVREAVRGYRTTGFQEEIRTATATLRSAGLEVECDVPDEPMSPTQEAVLSMALREASTNIVRHSDATSCSIRLETSSETLTLSISDNGRGGELREGSGLSGMRERVEMIGGRLQFEQSLGTFLTIVLPRDPVVVSIQEKSA